VLLGVFLRCVVVVLGGVQHVTMSDFGMVRGLLVIAGLGAAIEPALGPLAAAYVLFLAILGPMLARFAK